MELDLTIKRPAIRWHGSKFRLAPWIVGFFPAHAVYCEPYGGGAGVLIRKVRSSHEIYNDLDSDVVNLFRVLRSADTRESLCQQLQLTPFSREEYEDCFQPSDDPVERARRLVARSFMGFGSHSHNAANRSNGFRVSHWDGKAPRERAHAYAMEWLGVPVGLRAVAERFAGVTIEHRPASDIIARYDGRQTLFYVDPPYVRSSRDNRHKGYAHEMTDDDHRMLAWHLRRVDGKVIISGYDTALYRKLFAGWHREETKAMANGQWGAVERTEVLWMNFEPSPCAPS